MYSDKLKKEYIGQTSKLITNDNCDIQLKKRFDEHKQWIGSPYNKFKSDDWNIEKIDKLYYTKINRLNKLEQEYIENYTSVYELVNIKCNKTEKCKKNKIDSEGIIRHPSDSHLPLTKYNYVNMSFQPHNLTAMLYYILSVLEFIKKKKKKKKKKWLSF